MQIKYSKPTAKVTAAKIVVMSPDGLEDGAILGYGGLSQAEIDLINSLASDKELISFDKVVPDHTTFHNGTKLEVLHYIAAPSIDGSSLEAENKTVKAINSELGATVKKVLGKHDSVEIIRLDGRANTQKTSRAIDDAMYDYKDSITAAKIKNVYLSTECVLDDLNAMNAAMQFTRDLVTAPPNVVVPATLLEEAKGLVGKKIKLTAHDPVKENMAGLLAVGRGSSMSSEFIELAYTGKNSKTVDLVIIGKGITYDSGGYSLKPPKSMETMKGDMAGAASVLGLFKYLSERGSKINIVGLIPTCENMIGPDAIVPGEVITYSNGKTVEVLNTDAEGRLILADALIYSQKFKNATVIDVATLTGGIVAALGKHRTGMFTANGFLAEELTELGESTGDYVWRMPLDEEVYDPKSKVADLTNISTGPSAITAAMFLKEFAPEHWVHLDIAGTSGDAVGTGRPLPLLVGLISR